MKIFVTLDYEIYFGTEHGSVERCMTGPTELLAQIAARHRIPLVFFVDCGFLLKLQEYRKKFPRLNRDYEMIATQLSNLAEAGHDLQLHIHPHWEDSWYDGQQWQINLQRYKLVDFSEDEVAEIVSRYKKILQRFAINAVSVYRAGGWCLQPFIRLKKALKENGIEADSSVFRNGYYLSQQYDYDFRSVPDKGVYRFSDDPATEDARGDLVEYPIGSIRNSPLFYWRLFLLGRLNPYSHKPLGDGRAMPAPGLRTQMLTRFTHQCVSMDGYNAKLLPRALAQARRRQINHLTIIGHPKAFSRYSLQAIDTFIGDTCRDHQFMTFTREMKP